MRTDGQVDNLNEAADLGAGTDVEALKAEVAKWQERVPKLAAALRERNDELAALREQLRQQSTADVSAESAQEADARVRARDELIAELQDKIQHLNERHRELSGQLHAAGLDLEQATQDARSWQNKWQSVTQSLDEAVSSDSRSRSDLQAHRQRSEADLQALRDEHAGQLESLQREMESLKVRNSNLQETTDFANRQIDSLGQELSTLLTQTEEKQAQVEQLQAQHADLQTENDAAQTQLRAESERAAELEQTLAEQSSKLNTTAADLSTALDQQQQDAAKMQALHARLEQEEVSYQQAVAAAEQEQSALVAQLDAKDEVLDGLRAELAEARSNLAQSGELADELDALKAAYAELQQTAQQSADDYRGQIATLQTELTGLQQQLQTQETLTAEQQQLIDAHGTETAQWRETESALRAEISGLSQGREEAERSLNEEIERLSGCVDQAQQEHERMAEQRRELSERVEQLTQELDGANRNLQQRSELVRELELERETNRGHGDEHQQQVAALQRELTEALHRQDTFKEHAANLEERIEAQKSLMSDLEEELTDTSQAHAEQIQSFEKQLREANGVLNRNKQKLVDTQKRVETLERENTQLREVADQREVAQPAPASIEGDLSDQHKVLKLQQMLRERTEELDNLRWRLKQKPAASGADENILMILNQQLEDVRNENRRLQEKLSSARNTDDLTCLKGVGDKLVQQLAEVGYTRLSQIAELKPEQLEDESHALHGFRSRILRDDWIAQAQEILAE